MDIHNSTVEERFELACRELRNGGLETAEHLLHRIVQDDPGHHGAIHMLGLLALEAGLYEFAATLAAMAIGLDGAVPRYHHTRGLALAGQGLKDEALVEYGRTLELDPDFAEAHYNSGFIRQERGLLDEAAGHYREAIRLRPDFADAWYGLSVTAQRQGDMAGAIGFCRETLRHAPERAEVRSNLLLCLHYPHNIDAAELFAEHLRWADVHGNPGEMPRSCFTSTAQEHRQLRIGYVSPDLHRHSVSYFMEPVLAAHDRERFQIYCYADVAAPDDVTARLQGYAHAWRDLRGVSDDEAARLIFADEIDILIDLAGHTRGNRLGVFARRPAPVQATWLGYPDTTGLAAIQYRLTDAHADPPGLTEQFHTEQLIRLPEGFLCFRPPEESPAIGPLPFLTTGRITFGSFNNLAKVTPEMIALWARLLQTVHGSRFFLKACGLVDAAARRRVAEQFEAHGILSDRYLLLGAQAELTEHLNFYNSVDISLDTYPYNGTTTTCEALWMGVPVITLAGNTHVSRVGASLLANLGLSGLIAATAEDYLATAEALAGNPELLGKLRSTLRLKMAGSTLMDGARFTRNLENAYLEMWEGSASPL